MKMKFNVNNFVFNIIKNKQYMYLETRDKERNLKLSYSFAL